MAYDEIDDGHFGGSPSAQYGIAHLLAAPVATSPSRSSYGMVNARPARIVTPGAGAYNQLLASEPIAPELIPHRHHMGNRP